jgi:hypothetical protein
MAVISKMEQMANELYLHAPGSDEFMAWLKRIRDFKAIAENDKERQQFLITRYSSYLER